ncbi:hypothetical protein Ddye_012344 [Dipteronia dyeriana]|uniref:GTD-binding domain-containing protein n=1 Tax=Dipteronia dyeriana TaxID=168575 RepID=A0AAD9X454_9ROSI|nr:hypothetical protein Ddye_012344 [Dipteronia dyeriana]
MAANKFATMLHRNTHKIAVILIYAVLEWILIMFLLLNSFLTCLITRFANYFGLKPPCLWCSRVDHIFESANNNTTSYRDLVCETHATEISRLSYCSSHQKLAETQNMCNQCLVSQIKHDDECIEMTQQTFAFISWLSAHQLEKGDEDFRCSCCDKTLIRKLYPPCLLFKSSSGGASDYTQTENLILESMDDDNSGGECKMQKRNESQEFQSENDNGEECDNDKDVADEFQILSDIDSFGLTETAEENCSRSVLNLHYEEKETYEGETADTKLAYYSCDSTIVRCCSGEDDFLEIILGSEVNIDSGLNRVIPVKLIDSSTTAYQGFCYIGDEVLRTHDESETFDSELQSQIQANVLAEAQLTKLDECAEKTRCKELESLEIGAVEVEDPSVPQDLVSDSEACEQVIINQADQTLSIDGKNVGTETMSKSDNSTEETNGSDFTADQTKSKKLDSKEEADHAADQTQTPELIPSLPCIQEDQPDMCNPVAEVYNTSEYNLAQNYLDQKHAETEIMQVKMNLIDKNQDEYDKKFLHMPTSMESPQCLLKKQLLFEKREPGVEESLDGSVVSEMEGSDPIQTIERLRTALKAEQKTLSALYAELEEERSASSVATNQTMAMITRLQEEKAAMQMEALQYQRMMEEQSEYDQEALQLLNELMGKREREKQELEKELEIYRKKVLDYEAKEKIRMMRSINGSVRSRNSSAISEDSDELSIDLNHEARDEDGSLFSHPESSGGNITPGDAVLNLEEMALDCVKNMTALDDSLTEFEEERLSILDQLKMLEDKLVTLGDDEFMEDLKSIQHSPRLVFNDFDDNCCSSQKETGDSNGVSKDKLYPGRKTMVSMAKQLLPFLDAADNETEEGLTFEEQVEFQSVEMNKSSLSMTELDSKKLAIEEEVDHVYERLQALEADREFLKHCMSSIQKGDKGMDLLQEILQHLRDLRAVDLRVQNMSGDTSG